MKPVQMLSLDHKGKTIGVLDRLSPKIIITKLIDIALIVYATSIQFYFAICNLKGTILKQ